MFTKHAKQGQIGPRGKSEVLIEEAAETNRVPA
jgi:hypothetical protein